MRFAVFTHVQHFKNGNHFYAYSPYVREMNLWFAQVENVEIVAPLIEGVPNAISIPYKTEKLIFNRISSFNLLCWKDRFLAIVKIPSIFYKVFQVMHRADHLHIRCPGNIGLIACIAQIFFPNKPKTVKYAGNWDPNAKQPWSYNFQKKMLSNTFLTRNTKVLVYGEWPNQSKNILPFFTASFYNNEVPKTQIDKSEIIKFLFVGSLSQGKRPLFAIKIFENILKNNINARLDIYGTGIMESKIRQYIKKHNIEYAIRLMGNKKLSILKEAYKESHFLILPSKSEGWPKVIAEAMFFGCIPIATQVSCIPWMLDYNNRGILIDEDLKSSSQKVVEVLNDKQLFNEMSKSAIMWSQGYTLERFEIEIQKLL